MIPLRDVIPSRTTPWITLGLIAVHALAFARAVVLASSADALVPGYAIFPAAVSFIDVLASAFLHTSWLTLAADLLVLWVFGETLEDRLGHGRFLVLYLAGSAGAMMVTLGLMGGSAALMASGAGSAATIIGAYLMLFRNSRILLLLPLGVFNDVVELPALFLVAFWFLFHAIATSPPDSQALFALQVVGSVFGAVLVRALRRPDRLRPDWWDRLTSSSDAPRARRAPTR